MAEAGAEAGSGGATGSSSESSNNGSSSARYYCHSCNARIRPQIPAFVCPRCGGGFIEEVSETADNAQEDGGHDAWLDFFNLYSSPRAPGYMLNHIFASVLEGVNNATQGNLQSGGFLMPLYGNAGDYAWGRGGLDAVITQLLNQLDGAGPAPLGQQQIDEIPEVAITADQVKARLQCTVCMDDFSQNEVTRRLLCGHHFHRDCITPWLQIHATCPICRKHLGGTPSSSASSTSSFNGPPTTSQNNGGASSGGTVGGSNVLSGIVHPAANQASLFITATSPSTAGGAPSTSSDVPRRSAASYQEDDCD